MCGEETDPAAGTGTEDRRPSSGERDETVVRRRVDGTESMTDAVVSALVDLREATGADPPPTEREPLYETLDVGALDRLFTGGRDVAVRFRFEGFVFTVLCDEVVAETADE